MNQVDLQLLHNVLYFRRLRIKETAELLQVNSVHYIQKSKKKLEKLGIILRVNNNIYTPASKKQVRAILKYYLE